MLDLTSLANQPTTRSRERSGLPRRHVTFAMSERNPAYPAHAQDVHEDEDDRPLAQWDHIVVSGDGDDQPLVQPAPRKEPEERRDPATGDGDLAPLVPPRPPPPAPVRRRKRTASMARPDCHTGAMVPGDSREERCLDFGKNAEGEALRNIINKLSAERNLRDLRLKHYHMSTAQFKKRTTQLDIPGEIMNSTSTW